MPGPMSHHTRKGRVFVTEGSSTFKITYQVNLRTLRCQCHDTASGSVEENNHICEHTKHFLVEARGVYQNFIPLLKISRVRSWLLERMPKVTGDEINAYCTQFLQEEECAICMEHYGSLSCLSQCQSCSEPYHSGCLTRWKKGCPRCTYSHDLSRGAGEVDWPTVQGQ